MGTRILRPKLPRSGVSLSHLMATNQRKSRPHAPVQSCLCRHQVSGLLLFQSIHSSLENEAVVDLSGLHESVVDSDEDLADSLDVRLKKKLFLSSFSQPDSDLRIFSRWPSESRCGNALKRTPPIAPRRISTSCWSSPRPFPPSST